MKIFLLTFSNLLFGLIYCQTFELPFHDGNYLHCDKGVRDVSTPYLDLTYVDNFYYSSNQSTFNNYEIINYYLKLKPNTIK